MVSHTAVYRIDGGRMTYNLDPDETTSYEQFELGLQCFHSDQSLRYLPRSVCPSTLDQYSICDKCFIKLKKS